MYALTKTHKEDLKASYIAVLMLIVAGAVFLTAGVAFGSEDHSAVFYGITGLLTLLALLYLKVRYKKELNQGYTFQGDELLFYENGKLKKRLNVRSITVITHYEYSGIYQFDYSEYIREGFPYSKDILEDIRVINPNIRYETKLDTRFGLWRYLINY